MADLFDFAPPKRVASPNRMKNKPIATRTRGYTTPAQPASYTNNTTFIPNNNSATTSNNKTDDILDLFGYGMNDNTNNNTNANGNSSANGNNTTTTNTNTNANANNNDFDPFFDFAPPAKNNGAYSNDNNANKSNGNTNNNYANTTDQIKPIAKKEKKRKKKSKNRTKQKRAQTVASAQDHSNVNYNQYKKTNNNNNNNQPNKKKIKMKKIDVLPLLHKGIKANKFKLNGNKSKVRTFYLTENNYYFCWEAFGTQEKGKGKGKGGGLFSKKKSEKNNRNKVDKDRSIAIRSIKSLDRNSANSMNSYSFIPAQNKTLTLSITYLANGSDKKLNFMAYEPFHHQLFYDGLTQLISAARDPKRNLSEVFELYVDFAKEILPKHLRPQRFKWEPLGAGDLNGDKNQNDDDNGQSSGGGSSNAFFDDNGAKNVDVYDPTTVGIFGRSRMSSF